DVERGGDEQLREHDGSGGEADLDVQRRERRAQQAAPTERHQQRHAGYRRGQHHRQVEQRIDQGTAGEAIAREQVGDRGAQRDGQQDGGGGRQQAQPQRRGDDRTGQVLRQPPDGRRAPEQDY